ncbi:uracil-DNA glycosylase [Alteribacillus sp. HJP-4]|uniref:uracil-DNA glycosylase n=1 Tax=Alteribacillus sp. HJP-4 TaxID=2775394 RepID=UPI0035CD3801
MFPEELVNTCKKRMEPFDCEGFVFGQGPINPPVMFVGEAPGETEIQNGIPFSGMAGKEFIQFLHYLGYERKDVYITSAVRSRPFQWKERVNKEPRKYNRTPTKKETAAHAPLLDFEIQYTVPKIIAPMGKVAFSRLLGKQEKMAEVTGKQIDSPILKMTDEKTNRYEFTAQHYTIFPIYHPAAVLYNRSLESIIYSHLDKLKELIR